MMRRGVLIANQCVCVICRIMCLWSLGLEGVSGDDPVLQGFSWLTVGTKEEFLPLHECYWYSGALLSFEVLGHWLQLKLVFF